MALAFPRRLRSTTARFVVLIFIAQFVAMVAVAYLVKSSSERTLLKEQQALVSELRDELTIEFSRGGEKRLVSAIHDRIKFSRGGIAAILLTDLRGKKIAGNLNGWPPTVKPGRKWQVLKLYRSGNPEVEEIGIIATKLPDGTNLLTGHVIDSGSQLRRANEAALLAALLLALPLSLLVALTLAKVMNVRISAIARTADAVSIGDLSKRVAIDGTDDAFDQLGHSINHMLERIEVLVSELRMVTDGLAHDLRSPITRLKSVIERAVIETDDAACLAALEKVSAEAETLLSMLTTALQISRAEAGIGRNRLECTPIPTLFTDLVEIYGPLAEDQRFALEWRDEIGSGILIHRELMSQALGNLIENALKYATGGNRILLSAREEEGQAILSVSDDGPGIPVPQRELALKRFGRLDPARHLSGSGLGLSLVEAIARMHGGKLELADNEPGLIVNLRNVGPIDKSSMD